MIMEVIKYLNEFGLEKLKEEYGISVSQNEKYPTLYILNYSQIASERFNTLVGECRSLVVELVDGKWTSASRAFDRFYNYGEGGNFKEPVQFTAYEKLDGSLISIFHHPIYGWLYRTKSMLMPELGIVGVGVSWKSLIEESMAPLKMDNLLPQYTYICELTSPVNRIVTRYESVTLTLLACRSNKYGTYLPEMSRRLLADTCGFRSPVIYHFKDVAECVKCADELPDLREGFVIYTDKPVYKVKSPAYVRAHRLRGEVGLTHKRAIEIVIHNEYEEYLSVFPEDRPYIQRYINAYDDIFITAESLWDAYGEIEDNKEFALTVKDYPVASLLFRKRNGYDFLPSFNETLNSFKVRMMESYLCTE
mgnify:CR=1 FL=1